ncbi:MAG: HIT domain-containing protein [Planctomycetes bacterium]|nr:HIT domain-containing protein [Planctomycetota bacterium]
MPSIFSKIVAGEIPCHKVWEDDKHLAFLDINPWTYGHTLVIPKLEQDYLFDMPEQDYVALELAAKRVAQLLKDKLGCKRVCSMVVGYEVPHVHIHLLPTDQMSDFIPPGTMGMKEKPDFKEILGKLRVASNLLGDFAAAFNARNVEALKALFAPDATSQVMDSPFPQENGIDEIAAKSLNHMLDEETPLTASVAQVDGKGVILFRTPEGKLDAAAWISEANGKITRTEYIVEWHRAEELKLIELKSRTQSG